MTKLDLMREIKAAGLIRQLGKHADFVAVLELIDHLESEGLVEDVLRHREFDSPRRRVDQVRVARLSRSGMTYLENQ